MDTDTPDNKGNEAKSSSRNPRYREDSKFRAGSLLMGILIVIVFVGTIAIGASSPLFRYSGDIKEEYSLPERDGGDIAASPSESFVVVLIIPIVIVGVVLFLIAYGLLKRRRWARTLTMILSTISIIFNVILITVGLITAGLNNLVILAAILAIISGIILYYFARKPLKDYFLVKH
jgi:uncharacterized membrane protein YhaH (DUF805 family)